MRIGVNTGTVVAGEGGTLAWAVAGPVRTLDPLLARTRAEQIVSRQVHEPLIESLVSPLVIGVLTVAVLIYAGLRRMILRR